MSKTQVSTHRPSESGQAIVLIALGLIALLGFTALAIDGGMIYSDRRAAQNSTDAASLAGAGVAALDLQNAYVFYSDFECDSADAEIAYAIDLAQYNARVAAVNQATANGYDIDMDTEDMNGVETVCEEFDNGSWIDKYIDVRTLISDTTDTAFVQFVYPGGVVSQLQAVARLRPSTAMVFGNAIVALNDEPCSGHQNGVMFSGDIDVHINGGGVFSNGCLRGNGNSLVVDVDDGSIRYAGELTCNPSGCPGFDPSATQATGGQLPPDSYDVPEPDCSSLPSRGSVSTTGERTISPGVYTKIEMHSNNAHLIMQPGLYCITGSPKAMVISGGHLEGQGVTIFAENGEVLLSGNAQIELSAPPESPDPAPAIPGILIYLASGNTGAVEMEGNSDTWYLGTVFAPSGYIEAKGVAGTHPTFHTQLIAHDVEIGGNADIDINFNDHFANRDPAYVEMNE